MPGIRSTVQVTNNFPDFKRDISALAERAVAVAAVEGAKVASEVASERSKTGAMANMRVSSADRTYDGYAASFVSPVFYAWMQNWGTLGNRRKALKGSPRTNRTREPGTGVKPLRFLNAGYAAGRNAMLAVIEAGLPK